MTIHPDLDPVNRWTRPLMETEAFDELGRLTTQVAVT
jgi:hypothetical protein